MDRYRVSRAFLAGTLCATRTPDFVDIFSPWSLPFFHSLALSFSVFLFLYFSALFCDPFCGFNARVPPDARSPVRSQFLFNFRFIRLTRFFCCATVRRLTVFAGAEGSGEGEGDLARRSSAFFARSSGRIKGEHRSRPVQDSAKLLATAMPDFPVDSAREIGSGESARSFPRDAVRGASKLRRG